MAKCQHCGKEFNGNFCPECGTPAPTPTSEQFSNQSSSNEQDYTPGQLYIPKLEDEPIVRKKLPGWAVALISVGALLFIIAIFAATNNTNNKDDDKTLSASSAPTYSSPAKTPSYSTPSSSSQPPVSSKPEAITQPFEIELGAGNYAAGIDIPVGVYNLVAVSGSGNVFSTEGLNEIMSGTPDDFYIQTYNNANLPFKAVLRVSGDLVVKLTSEKAYVDNLSPRTNSLTEPVTLSSGNYTAGVDFLAGIYDIRLVQGSGNVISSEAGVNEIFGSNTDYGYIKSFKNAPFTEGAELEISGVTIELVPSVAG